MLFSNTNTTYHIEHKTHMGGHFCCAASRSNSLSRSVRASSRRLALQVQVHGGSSSTVRFFPASAATISSRRNCGRGFGFALGSMKTGAGYFATAPSDLASAAFSGDSKASHAIAGDSGGSHKNADSFASLEQEMATGRSTSEQVTQCVR